MTDGDGNAAPCRTLSAGDVARFVQAASTRRGHFDLGRASMAVADALGDAWVGPDARTIRKPGLAFEIKISADALRQFRSAACKPTQGRTQADYDWRTTLAGNWDNRGRLDIAPTCP